MNRNLMREDTGYLLGLRTVRELPAGSWLVNQHIPHLFRFTEKELDYLEGRYRQRAAMIAEFVPWDDPNYAIDEEWAWFYPYGIEAKRGDSLELELRIWNHSTRERTFEVSLGDVAGLERAGDVSAVTIPARGQGSAKVSIRVTEGAGPGVRVLTAGLRSKDLVVKDWVECLIRVSERRLKI